MSVKKKLNLENLIDVQKGGEFICKGKNNSEFYEKIFKQLKDENQNVEIKEFVEELKNNQFLFTEIMSRFYNDCLKIKGNASEVEGKGKEKVESVVIFKNQLLTNRLTYIPKLIDLLDKYVKLDKPIADRLTAKKIYRLLDVTNDNKEVDTTKRDNIDKFFQSFLSSEEYTHLVGNPKKYYEKLIIKKIGNLLKYLIISSDVIINTKKELSGGGNKSKTDELSDLIDEDMYTAFKDNQKITSISKEEKLKTKEKIIQILLKDLNTDDEITEFIKLYKMIQNKEKGIGKTSAREILKNLEIQSWDKVIKKLKSEREFSKVIKDIFNLLPDESKKGCDQCKDIETIRSLTFEKDKLSNKRKPNSSASNRPIKKTRTRRRFGLF